MTSPTARELLIKAITMNLGFVSAEAKEAVPSFEMAAATLEKSTPLQRVGYAAQGLKMWGEIVEFITEELLANDGRLPPDKANRMPMVEGSRACLAVYCEAYAAALRELGAASLVSP